MSFGRTLLNESGIENELNSFLEYLVDRLDLNRNDVFRAMRDYKKNPKATNHKTIRSEPAGIREVSGVKVESTGISIDNSMVKPRGNGGGAGYFEGPVMRSEADRSPHIQETLVEPPSPEPSPQPRLQARKQTKVIPSSEKKKGVESNTSIDEHIKPKEASEGKPQLTIKRKGDRYMTEYDPSFLKGITNSLFMSLLKRKTLSEEECNYLKSFLRKEQIPFKDAPTKTINLNTGSKITDIASIMAKVQQDMDKDERLSPEDSRVTNKAPTKPTKLKLVKLTTNTAWDKETKYVFRLNRTSGKVVPVAFAVRMSRDDDNQILTEAHIEDLKERGLSYDLAFSNQ